jgi:hypothetical protein
MNNNSNIMNIINTTDITYDNFRNFLDKKYGKFITETSIECRNNICLINTDNLSKNAINSSNIIEIPNMIIDKTTMQIICVMPNVIKVNNINKYITKKTEIIEAISVLSGLDIVLFHNDDIWYVCTHSNINSDLVTEIFYEIAEKKINLEELDKDLCYYFVMVGHKLKKIIGNYALFHHKDELILKYTCKKYTKDFNYDNCFNEIYALNKYTFENLEEINNKLNKISYDNKNSKNITVTGFDIFYNDCFIRVHTSMYYSLIKHIPENMNINLIYVQLYQNNKLSDILPFISKYASDIIYRINTTMKTISKEILNIYHATRKQKNTDLYESLSEIYKKIIYDIHGMYIINRKKEINENNSPYLDGKAITIHDVYYYLKNIKFNVIIQLFNSRTELLSNPLAQPYVIKNCILTAAQINLVQERN